MTPTLQTLIKEYDDSLTRVDGEKDQQKRIVERAHVEHGIDPAAFRKAAAAYHQDKLSDTLKQLTEQVDLIEGLIDAGPE
jgi:hypothetical protein